MGRDCGCGLWSSCCGCGLWRLCCGFGFGCFAVGFFLFQDLAAAFPALPEFRVGVDWFVGAGGYGGEFVTAVEREPVYGVQFHPEKSGPHGLRLLGNFAAICGVATPARRAA